MTNTTSNQDKFDLAVLIGRFQPFHLGHLSVIEMGLNHATDMLVLVGSASSPRSHRNPFTYEERVHMILGSLQDDAKLYTDKLEDAAYNDTKWVRNTQLAVERCLDNIAEANGYDIGRRKAMRVALIGHSKDQTSYYLNMFPGYASLEAPNYMNVSSTPMRNAYFSNIGELWLKNCDGHRPGDKKSEHLVPAFIRDFLITFAKTPTYKEIVEEYKFIVGYKAQWASSPFPVTMVTTDAVVLQSGHILLVRRKGRPFRGKWALPGGYLSKDETIVNGMIRELVEETRIEISPENLKKCIVGNRVFDDTNRDPRGRVISHGFRIDLPSYRNLSRVTKKKVKPEVTELEPVEGADDAEYAKWFPLSSVKREMMAFDHMDIINALGVFN